MHLGQARVVGVFGEVLLHWGVEQPDAIRDHCAGSHALHYQ